MKNEEKYTTENNLNEFAIPEGIEKIEDIFLQGGSKQTIKPPSPVRKS